MSITGTVLTGTLELQYPTFLDSEEFKIWENRCRKVYDLLPPYYRDKRPYQWQFAAMYCLRAFNLFAGAMGIGKTLITLVKIKALYNLDEGRPGRIHIVVPSNTAFTEWKQEMDRVIPGTYTVIQSEKDLLGATTPIFLYTIHLPKRKSTDGKYLSRFLSKQAKPNFLIVDELDAIGRESAVQFKELSRIRRSAKRVLGLTGTPAEHPHNIHTYCKFIYQNEWPFESIKAFKAVYINQKELNSHYISGANADDGTKKRALAYVKFDKLPSWAALLRRYIHRANLDDANIRPYISVPSINYIHLKSEPTEATLRGYEELVNRVKSKIVHLAEDSSSAAEALSLCTKLLTKVNYPDHKTSKVESLSILQTRHRTLLYTDLIGSGDYVTNYLNELGLDYIRLTSSHTLEQRERIINSFKTDARSTPLILVLPIRIGARALNFPMVDSIVFYCPGWRSVTLNQAMRRAARPGNQLDSVDIYLLYHLGCIDEHQINVLAQKAKATQQALDFYGYNSSDTPIGKEVLGKL
jgi:SNF2 family DNA or RNA helicase